MSGVQVFGIRHLSPAGAWHLRTFLYKVQPSIVLVEGPSDAGDLMTDLFDPRTKLPAALLAFTQTVPVRMVAYPFAEYSPEFEAFRWAREHKIPAQFMDLPTSVSLSYEHDFDLGREMRYEINVYQAWAEKAGEVDHDTCWERLFELGTDAEAYRQAAYELGSSFRGFDASSPAAVAYNLIREAWMRKTIADAVAAGHQPEKIVAVCGAFHAPALTGDSPPEDAALLADLKQSNVNRTLMPYSYFRLSSQSGYGAGNRAPAYFDLLWECLQKGELDQVPVRYLSQLAGRLRGNGQVKSTAQVIEAVRLAEAMAGMYSGKATLRELKDSAVTCLGEGSASPLLEAMAWIEVGPKIGTLPPGVSRTAVQDDFYRELESLRLSEFRSPVLRTLELDLRKNLQVKSEESAFLDLRRSRFLHRLRALGIPFARHRDLRSDASSWKEAWDLSWTPEAEMALVETNLKGESLETALAFEFGTRLEAAAAIPDLSLLIYEASLCDLNAAMRLAESRLQSLAADSESFLDLSEAALRLSVVIGFGGVRQYNTGELAPLLAQIFYRACHLLTDAALCGEEASEALVEAIDKVNRVSLELSQVVDEELWISQLKILSSRDDRNPKASGYACAILIERSLMDETSLDTEVARRLSPGIEPDIGAGWFEGLAKRNAWALISRLDLWRHLDRYMQSLDDGQFARALVFLRRTFGELSPQEKRSICQNLAELWKVDADVVENIIQAPVDKQTKEKLESLNDFDFEDL